MKRFLVVDSSSVPALTEKYSRIGMTGSVMTEAQFREWASTFGGPLYHGPKREPVNGDLQKMMTVVATGGWKVFVEQ